MDTTIIVKKERQSNIELLRILSMFMIVLFHANYFSLGAPEVGDIDLIPRAFMECLCTGAVNTFVLISGWFGIKTTIRGITNLLFQCFFICTFIYVLDVLKGGVVSSEGIRGCLLMTADFWFIKAYIALYLISPALNLMIERFSFSQLLYFLGAFYLFQTLYGWVIISTEWIAGGYSFFSFIGLYVLARTVNIYSDRIKIERYYSLLIYIACILVMTVLEIVGIYKSNILAQSMMAYSNPLVIISSMCLVYYFSTLKLSNKVINWIAKSCLAVYLVHLHPSVVDKFILFVQKTYIIDYGFKGVFALFLFCILVFVISILFDNLRLFFWNLLQRRFRVLQH